MLIGAMATIYQPGTERAVRPSAPLLSGRLVSVVSDKAPTLSGSRPSAIQAERRRVRALKRGD
jgi:hypothetical protein